MHPDAARIAHLLRRTGFGPVPGEVEAAGSYDDTLATILAGEDDGVVIPDPHDDEIDHQDPLAVPATGDVGQEHVEGLVELVHQLVVALQVILVGVEIAVDRHLDDAHADVAVDDLGGE